MQAYHRPKTLCLCYKTSAAGPCLTRLLFISFFIFQTTVSAQYNADEYTTSPALVNRVSISGIAVLDNKLYMAAERCKKLFITDLTTHQIIDTLQLICSDTLEIEGITAHNKELYCVSESNSKIYHINLKSGLLTEVHLDIDFQKLLGNFRGEGLEGLAASSKAKLFYVLLERNATKDHAALFIFDVQSGSSGIVTNLKYKSSYKLYLDSVEMRYSDLCLDTDEKRLLLIQSSYKNKMGSYSIKKLELNSKGIPTDLPQTYDNLNTTFLTQVVKSYENLGFDSNIEGIAIDAKNTIYLMSDNAMGAADCEPAEGKAPKQSLLLEFIKY